MRIEIQLDEEQAEKLAQLQQQTQQNQDVVIKQAIETYYQQLQPVKEALQAPEDDRLAKFKHSKFIGSFSGSPDLSTNAKAIFHSIMDEKYPRSQQPNE